MRSANGQGYAKVKVLLDTSAIYPDVCFRSADSRILLDAIGTRIPGVLVPEVVLRELVNKQREALVDAFDTHQKLTRTLTQVCVEPPERLMRPANVGERGAAYHVFLINLMKPPLWLKLPMPQVSHDAVVTRELLRRKPFSPKGTGYRDYLIWLSLLEYAKANPDPIHFITGNTKDFAEGGELHPDLVADLKAIRADRRIHLHTSIRAFVGKSILPTLAHDDRILREIERGSLRDFDLREWFVANQDEMIYPDDIGGAGLGTGPDGFHVHFRTDPEILSVDATEVRTLNSGDTLVHGAAKVRVELSVSSSETDFDRREVREFWQTSGGDVSMNDECEVDIRFAVVLEKNTHRVTLGELLAIEGETTELTYVNPRIPKE